MEQDETRKSKQNHENLDCLLKPKTGGKETIKKGTGRNKQTKLRGMGASATRVGYTS